jgi:hypothetical protein
VAWFTSLLEQGDMRALTLQQIAGFEEALR